ncbi:MAG: glycosyltransferase family 4 protein [Balneolaceae bacterium]|nr:glycosyltransferase family 4 protein [Balneolaceae bacterium]
MSKKKALIITYYWPPASSPGVQRWLKFVKFLDQLGWETYVITPKSGSYPNTDETLLNDVPESTRVIRTSTMEPFRIFNVLSGNLKRGKVTSVGMGDLKGSPSLIKKLASYIRANWFIPDARKGWGSFAFKAAKKIILKENIDLVITTGPPHSTHLVGHKLSSKLGVPWVVDFRDPWTNIYYNSFLPRTKSTIEKDRKLETLVATSADLITTVSSGLVEEFENRAKKIMLLPNGYDHEDFSDLTPSEKSNKFELAYIGNFKENQNCIALWKALQELIEENKEFGKHLKLSLIGNTHSQVLTSLEEHALLPYCSIEAFVQHHTAVRRMIDASGLLFIIPDTGDNKKIITGKIFEYLASRTPLISLGPIDGDAANILSDCERSPMIDYSDKTQIKARIFSLYTEWANHGSTATIENNLHQKFSRKQLSQELNNELRELLNEY